MTIEYEDGTPVRVDTVVISAQHRRGGRPRGRSSSPDVRQHVIDAGARRDGAGRTRACGSLVNPTGRFEIGGPKADTGLTGRKIMVDSYGAMAPHGGGCFSGKDPTKVDRSAAYMGRYVAKNVVAAGLGRPGAAPGGVRHRHGAPRVAVHGDVRDVAGGPGQAPEPSSGSASTSVPRPSSSTSTCGGRSTGRPPRTATSGARASPGRRPTAPTTLARAFA